jgi:hypothetical protein
LNKCQQEEFQKLFCYFFTGLTAFDYIVDYDEWIECGYFMDDIKARLKGK